MNLLSPEVTTQVVHSLAKECGWHGAQVAESTKYMAIVDEILKAKKK